MWRALSACRPPPRRPTRLGTTTHGPKLLWPIWPTSLGPLLLPYRPLVKAIDVTAMRATCRHRYATARRVVKLVRRWPEAVLATKYCWAPVIKWGRLKAGTSHNILLAGLFSFIRGKVGVPLACRAWAAPSAARAPRRPRPSRSRRCRSRRSSSSCEKCSNLFGFVCPSCVEKDFS